MGKFSTLDIILASWVDGSRMIPALWGPPRRGKTYTAKQAGLVYTKGDPSRVKVINPALDLPEDLGGIPRVRRGRTFYSAPPILPEAWFDDGPSVLIVDEIDKAQVDTLCCLLTMLSYERRIRDTHLPVGTRIVVCGNEPQSPLPEPLTARLINLRFPEGRDVADRVGQYIKTAPPWAAEVAQRLLGTPSVSLPLRPCTGDDSIQALVSWSQDPIWQDPDSRTRIMEGLCRPQDIPVVLEILDAEELDKDHLHEWLREAPLAALIARFHRRVGEACEGAVPQVVVSQALGGLVSRAEKDATGEIRRAVEGLLKNPAAMAALGPQKGNPRLVWEEGRKAWAQALQ